MNPIACLACLLLAALPPPGGSLQDTLVALEHQAWVAWKARDGSFYQGFLSDDHVEVGSSGVVGKAAVVALVGSDACKVASYAIRDFKLTVFDANTAVLTYHAEQETLCGGQKAPSPAWVTSLYVKRKGRWLNALFQELPASG